MAGSGFDPSMFAGGAGQLLGGLFGDSGAPYGAAMGQYRDWANKAQEAQNPFYNAGTGAIPKYQNWLDRMQDPSGFINGIMGGYQQSPWANYMQQQSMRAGQNAASASGLMGSTPFAEQMQQNAANISSQDMQNWLQNVLGINSQYGRGEQGLMQGGQNAANALANMYGNFGQRMGEAAYGREAGGQQDMWNTLGGAASLAAMFL